MRKTIMLVITFAFLLGCAAYPPPVAAKKKAEQASQAYKIGDLLQINVGKGVIIDVVVTDIQTQSSAATGEIKTFYRVKEEKFYTLPEGDPRLQSRAKEKKK